jgi:hypothetical protein
VRVLAVTTNASLVVALGSMMREWEVVTVRDAERAMAEAPGAVVALIDLGETDAGVQVADQLYHGGITIPCVVLGDKPVDDSRAKVLLRPFTLEDLGTAVREAAGSAARSGAPAAPARPTVAPEPVAAEPAAPVRGPEKIAHEGNGSPGVSSWQEERVERPIKSEPAVAPEPEQVSPPRPPLQVVETPEPARAAVAEPDVQAPRFTKEEPAWEPPDEESELEPAADTDTSSFWDEPSDAEPVRESEAAGRWKLRRKATRTAAPEVPAATPLVGRLKSAAAHAREIEDLIEQMPFLADLRAMADGLIGEIDRQFVCAITSVSVRRDDGYEVVAHRGLSRVEAGMIIPVTQSLFSDVLKTHEGVLIQPVDLAQGLVAGIGGARTEAMMVAPALVNGEVAAMVVVGGERFTEIDLDRLTDLAAEGAPGLAVAELLDRLRSRVY